MYYYFSFTYMPGLMITTDAMMPDDYDDNGGGLVHTFGFCFAVFCVLCFVS